MNDYGIVRCPFSKDKRKFFKNAFSDEKFHFLISSQGNVGFHDMEDQFQMYPV